MKQLSRVVWSEGMHLAPHHFQAQARYFEDTVHFATSALWFAGYGFAGCELDAEALKNGTVSLLHARGLFSDGLAFDMPQCDPLPAARNIADLFSPVSDRLNVFLSIPARRPGAAVVSSNAEDRAARFIAEPRTLHDENTGLDEKKVDLGRKNIALHLENELNDGWVSLPLARVMRDGTGHFMYDPEFIPPCLRLTASAWLQQVLRRLMEIMVEKSQSLAPSAGAGELASSFSQQELVGFWFRHCLNSSLAALRNLCYVKQGHPEEIYVELCRLAGALSTFALEARPGDLPLYDHDHLDRCLGELDAQIRFLLETVIPTNCVTIPLARSRNYFYAGEIRDTRVLGPSRWVFSIRCAIGEADLIRWTPQLVKICSEEFVPKLVQRALPGLTLTHMPAPPSAVSPRVEHQYFSISKQGPCWDHMVKTRRIGVYAPGELPEPEIGLHVILGA